MIRYLLPTKHAATVQTLGHPAAGVIGWFDTSANVSGVSVTNESALTFAAVWCAVRVIAETLGTLPCVLYERTGDDSREKAKDDWRYDLMRYQPHPQISAANFIETQTAHMVMSGNCYARIRYSAGQLSAQLEPRSPDSVTMQVDGDRITYDVQGGRKETLPAEQMLHIAGLGGDGVTGWSVIRYAQQSIGTGMAGEQFAASMHGSGSTPHGVIEFPGRLDKEGREQLRREWNQIHQGANKAGNIGIMHGGMKFQPVSMSAEDAQFLQSREYSVREIARWFRLPPHMLADLADSSVRANIEQQALEFVTYSLKPWIVKWQQALNRKLLTPDERKSMYYEFMVDSLLSTDQKSRYDGYAVGRQWGFLSINDIRRKENMNLVENGDDYLEPVNMRVVGDEPEPAPQQPAIMPPQMDEVREELQEAHRRQIVTIKRVGRVLAARLVGVDLSSINAAIAESEHELMDRLGGIRGELIELHKAAESTILTAQQRHADAIRGDIAGIRDTLASTVADTAAARVEAMEACDDLFRDHLTRQWHVEQAKVLAAARAAERGNRNFVAWLDEFYQTAELQLAGRVFRAAAAYGRLAGRETPHERIAAEICRRHKQQLLDATDGDRAGFVGRVESLIAAWHEDITTTHLGDTICQSPPT